MKLTTEMLIQPTQIRKFHNLIFYLSYEFTTIITLILNKQLKSTYANYII